MSEDAKPARQGWKPGSIIQEIKAERQARRRAAAGSASSGSPEPSRISSPQPSPRTDGPSFSASPGGPGLRSPVSRQASSEDGKKMVSSGNWYPGKYLKLGVRKAINKKLSTANLEASQTRQDGGRVVGQLSWRLKSVKNVQLFNPYLEVIFEGTKRVIKCSNFVENYQEGQQRQPSTSWSEAELVFPVTDITANLYVLLQDKRLMTSTAGVLIMPLVNLLGLDEPKSRQTMVCDLVAADFLDLDKRPLICQKYSPALGLDQPKSVGQLEVEVELEVEQRHLIETYLASTPLAEDSFEPRAGRRRRAASGEKKEESLDELDISQLIISIYRLKLALQPPPLARLLLDLPLLFLPLWAYACYTFAPWKLPLWAMVCFSLNGWLNARKGVLPEHIDAWPKGVVDKIVKARSTRPLEKIKGIKRLFKSIQDQLALAATALERSTNAWNWSDPRISITVQACLLPLTALTSLLLYLIPPQLLVFLLGTALYARAYKKARAGPETPPAESGQKGQGDEGEDEEEEDNDGLELQWAGLVDVKGLVPRLASNVLSRTPDFPELVHRAIARHRARPVQS